eukprot:609502-Pyramimonas_sp.AAC.1
MLSEASEGLGEWGRADGVAVGAGIRDRRASNVSKASKQRSSMNRGTSEGPPDPQGEQMDWVVLDGAMAMEWGVRPANLFKRTNKTNN